MNKTEPEKNSPLSCRGSSMPVVRYCEFLLFESGQIQISGDRKTVDDLIKAIEKSDYQVSWWYKSPCG
ncbi:MAG: hypothetical protein K9L23_21770 [Desulfotignum sp.]|nr:hypothetical protein [Desulfotignum sp.]